MVRVGIKLLPALLYGVIFLSTVFPALAISSPSLSSPSDSSTTSSSTLSWQAVEGSIRYKVIVDDEPTVTSPYFKDPYYTTNTHYSPQLGAGRYYWKVTAQDSAGTWSEWSPIWSFTLSSSVSSPTPSSSPSTNPSSSPNNSPASSSSPKSAFTISGTPSQVDVSQSFSVTIDLTLTSNPNSVFYFKGAFKKADSSNYFGQTKVGSSWIKNGASYSNQFQATINSAGHWSGSLEVQPDSTDSGFKGSGDYTFKVGRYSASGSGPTWSNEVTIHLSGQQGAEQINSVSSHSTSSPKASSAVKGTSTITTASNPSSSTYNHPIGSSSASASIEPSPTPEVEIKGEKKANIFPIIGGILILVGLIFIIFIYLKNRSTTNI